MVNICAVKMRCNALEGQGQEKETDMSNNGGLLVQWLCMASGCMLVPLPAHSI